jgi:hypothetical protein
MKRILDENAPPVPLPPGVPSFGDRGLDRLMAIALAMGATITKISDARPVAVQLPMFEDAA